MRLSSPALRFVPALLALTVAGCLPYSCNRVESRLLFPQDSTSRAFASVLPVDTLQVLEAPDWGQMEYPRTVAFAPDGTLWGADTGRHSLNYLDPDGESGSVDLDSLRYPYLAGFRQGFPVVFSPDAHRIVAVGGDWSVPTPSDVPPRVLQYAAADDSAAWMKLAGKDYDSRLISLAPTGEELSRIGLPDPYWRWAGALELREGRPVSLSGYRPQFYEFDGGILDSTSLFGFDSPMLPRSRAFLTGQSDQPPLLTPAGVFVGSKYYTLNIRPGWLQVDIYDENFRLERILVEPDPSFGPEFYPTDLAVRLEADGSATLAIAVAKPEPSVRMYRADDR